MTNRISQESQPTPGPAAPKRVVQSLVVRFHVYPQGGRWLAASTDFVVAAEGSTEEEAVAQFVELTRAYVEGALARGWLDALNRRPKFVRRIEIRARYRLAKLLHRNPKQLRRQLQFA